MAEPERVADCVRAMREVATVPVTVKTRIGIDDSDDYDFLAAFIDTVRRAGCEHFIVHARKAILAGLSPKENRTVPPLDYDRVYRLKSDFPELRIVLNGGIDSIDAVRAHLEHVDGVMVGRKAYADPFFLTEIQANFLSTECDWRVPTREQVINKMAEYAEHQLRSGVRLHHITRHMLGLYSGQPGARRWRRFVSQKAVERGSGPEVLLQSLSALDVAA